MELEEGLGFWHLKEPTGYGSVKLKASINGIDIGSAWSHKAKYDEGSEHAEDNVIEYVQSLFLASELNLKVSDLDRSVIQSIYDNKKVEVLITNLTASPCSSKRGTTKEKEGCAEKLIELLNDYKKANISIAITADHYYQPKNVEDAKAKSKKACKDLRNAGIKVTITNP